ncbi:MAG: hypothetical protein M3N93_06370 [Acidobacteriota bacterium]|nr:hypothetical protein [Acidobacteriota bacterium]
MNKQYRDIIARANALHSTGPRTEEGKQRSSMNAFKHNLSGNNLILKPQEYASYKERSAAMLADLKPQTEPERQIAQKIIDLNFRLNRITAIENNMLNFDMCQLERDAPDDERVESMYAQTLAWKEDAPAFDVLGRYEARLSKQLLQYQKEFERLQSVRKAEQAAAVQATEKVKVNEESASFGKPAPAYRMSSALPPVASALPALPPIPRPPAQL